MCLLGQADYGIRNGEWGMGKGEFGMGNETKRSWKASRLKAESSKRGGRLFEVGGQEKNARYFV
jgi:hypothetical protein